MDKQELEQLFGDLESDRVERKASDSDRKKIKEAICAFANDLPNHQKPGVLFIGVNDDGSCSNLTVNDDLLLKLANIRSEANILPIPHIEVSREVINGCELAVIVVYPSDAPPVRFDGRTFIRVGPRRAISTAEEERRLNEKRIASDLPFDLKPFVSATINDLDIEYFRREYLPFAIAPEILEENQRSIEQQLASLRFITPEPNSYPTALGIFVCGKEARQFIPGFYIQFIRFDGNQLTDPIKDQQEVTGYLIDILKNIDEILRVNISTATSITTSTREIQHPDYPIVALQQLVRNAILHRSYESNAPTRIYWFTDRIEVQSPGGLFGQVNERNFDQGMITDYRNPHIAEAMKNLGYIQRFGIGIKLAQDQLNKNGNPPLQFIVEASYISVTIRSL